MEKSVKVAVLGCGNRAKKVINNLLRDSERRAEIAAVYDPDPAEMQNVKEFWGTPDAMECRSHDEAIGCPGVEWVMIFSPNAFHHDQILAAFKAGKHVFSEKPIGTTIKDCIDIYDAYKSSGKLFATGFVLRYGPIFRKVKELLDSGKFGHIISICAEENIPPYHGAYIMANWRRNTAMSGPHILEKCCHDLDLLNWYCKSLPSRVASFGGRDFFIPENEVLRDKYGHKIFEKFRNIHGVDSPFTSDKDLMDNQVAIIEYRNHVRVQFQCTMCNPMPSRRMYFSCSEGTIMIELYDQILRYRILGTDAEQRIIYKNADGHAGGDDFIMKELFHTMLTGEEPKCSGSEGLESAVLALGIDEAARTGKIVDLEPTWKKLNR